MPLDVKNLDWLSKVTVEGHPEFGSKLRQALLSIQKAHNNVELQTNTNSTGEPPPPHAINGLNVKAQNGHFSIAITDNNENYRGNGYFVEHADNPNFTNPTIVPMGPSRNTSLFLGNVTRYFRAYSGNPVGPSSPPVYHSTPVTGGGIVGGPPTLPSQGSGTGIAGVGLVGYGPTQFRSATGKPPVRPTAGVTESGPSGLSALSPGALPKGPSIGTQIGGGGGGGGGGTGTVTSVALTAPAEFSVGGSPITTSGTLAITKANENANLVWAGPTTGSPAQPAFRALVAADLPGGTGTVSSVAMTVPTGFSVTGSPITTSGTLALGAVYQMASYLAGIPGASQVVGLWAFLYAWTLPANCAGSGGKCDVNPTATATYTIKKNGSSIGTVIISTGGVFSFTTTSGLAVNFIALDEMSITAPASPDATLSNVLILILGNRS